MGLIIGQKTIRMERRFKRMILDVDLKTNEYKLVVEYDDGFYDENNIWNTISTGAKTLTTDQVLYLWNFDANELSGGENGSRIGDVIRRSLYMIIGDDIDLDVNLDIKVFNENNEPMQANVKIFRNNDLVSYYSIPSLPYSGPLILNAKVVVEIDGHEIKEFYYPVLVGNINLELQLNAINE